MKWHQRPLRILIVSATVGAGDAGNARELARRLETGGHQVTVKDFLDAPRLRIGRAFTKGYEAELRHAPWAYEAVFRVWFWMPFVLAPLSRVVSFFTRRRISQWVREAAADVVVSTYPVGTQALGDMRRRALCRWPRRHGLAVPTINVVTDFGYHPFWSHPDIDLNLAVYPETAAEVARHTGRPSTVCAPLVGPGFAQAPARRAEQRARLGLSDQEVAVLVTSGSWGVGAVAETFEMVARQPGFVPVVACGRNDKLRRRLAGLAAQKHYRGLALGWTDDMPGLMAACDVMVENAGGLSSLEAMAAGLPLVSYHPIPGHGRNSARIMDAAGVSSWARSDAQLMERLEALGRPGPARTSQLRAAAALFSADAALAVTGAAAAGALPRPQLRPVARLVHATSSAVMAGALGWFGLTTGVGVAAAAGLGVAHPPPGTTGTVYLGVRLSGEELANPAVQAALRHVGATAVLSAAVAERDPADVRRLVDRGTDIVSGGIGLRPGTLGAPTAPWALAQSDTSSVQELSALAGQPVTALVPDRTVSAFDLVDASSQHVTMVVPNVVLPVAPTGPFPRQELGLPVLQAEQIYLVNGVGLLPNQLVTVLDDTSTALGQAQLASAPFSGLQ